MRIVSSTSIIALGAYAAPAPPAPSEPNLEIFPEAADSVEFSQESLALSTGQEPLGDPDNPSEPDGNP